VFKKYDSIFSMRWQAGVTGNFIGLPQFSTVIPKSLNTSPAASFLCFLLYQMCYIGKCK